MSDPQLDDLIFDWNALASPPPPTRLELNDETLRDGLQSPSIQDPPIEIKIKLLHYMVELGIDSANIGMPCTGPNPFADTLALAKEVAAQKLPLRLNCAARTVISDVEPIVEISQQAGIPVEASTFLGCSAIRSLVEGWELDRLLKHTEEAVSFAVSEGLPVMYVTEDTTRGQPETIKKLYRAAIDAGAKAITLADTVGYATPDGVRNLIQFVRNDILRSGEDVRVDWHGHNDRGLAVANALFAYEAGADCVHASALGIGERVGNTPMDQVLVNMKVMGWMQRDMHALNDYCELVREHCAAPLPFNYPVMGHDAFRTSTGVHASAIVKAQEKGAEWLANRVYSGVPSDWFGRGQLIEIGPMSGKSNVVHWLRNHDIDVTDELVSGLLEHAKQSKAVLTEQEINNYINSTNGAGR
jgi:2-isopropylmalate synthase